MGRKPTVKLNAVHLTGIPGIDVQHNELFFMSNALNSLKKEKASPDSACAAAQELITHFKLHCTIEEGLLDMIAFPRAEEHKAQHKKLLAMLRKNLKALTNSKTPDIGSFAHIFQDAMLAHISDYDREYVTHIDNLIDVRKKYKITALRARDLVK